MRIKSSFIVCLYAFTAIISSCSVTKKAVIVKTNIIDSAAKVLINSNELSTAHAGIAIYDPSENKYLYQYQSEKYFIPASNIKIITCYAAMKYLGDSLVGLRYNIESDTQLAIEFTADPTFLHPDFHQQPVFDFLKKFRTVKYNYFRYLNIIDYGKGWSWDDYLEEYMLPISPFPIFGNMVRVTFNEKSHDADFIPAYFSKNHINQIFHYVNAEGISVSRPFGTNKFIIRAGNNQSVSIPFQPSLEVISEILEDTLKINLTANSDFPDCPNKIHSQPTDSLLKIMMHRSDNFYAEQSLLMVSNEQLNVMNDEKIIDTLLKTDFQNIPQKPRWVDGSGLSRYNNFTPQDFVFVLDKMRKEFSWNRITTIFPTCGNETALTGKVYSKSGAMSNVTCLSGYIITDKGKTLIFSVLVNNHMSTTTIVRNKIETFLSSVITNY